MKIANWLAVNKVIAKISRLTFLAHPVYPLLYDASDRNKELIMK